MSDQAGPAVAISVVIPTRDRPELLDRCLGALAASIGDSDEVIVVDSASRSRRVREVAEAHRVRYVRLEVPGTSLARNEGWRAASGDVIAFVDDDILVSAGWAAAIRETFAADTSLALLTGRVQVPPEHADVHHPTALVDHEEPGDLAEGPPHRRGISGNVAISRGALERVGGFDEALGPGRFFRAAEDKDLFDRILLAGMPGRYEPAMLVAHFQWRRPQERLRLDWSYGLGAGAHLAKLVRLDRRHARMVAGQLLLDWGFRDLRRNIASRYKLGSAAAVLRIAGILAGFVTGLAVPVRHGHYALPRRRVRS